MSSLPFSHTARWIHSSVVGSPRSSAPCPFLRKSFNLEQPVKSARLTATALGLYECEINGRLVGDQVFAPGWTNYDKRVMCQTYDVTPMLQQGENVIGAILGDGWYCGFVAWRNRQNYGDRPRFLAELEVSLADGTTQLLGTDWTWKTTTGPVRESDFLMGEIHDARMDLGEWSRPGYVEQGWEPVLVEPLDQAVSIEERLGPPVRRIETIKPRLASKNGGRLIHDCGQNFSGRARIAVRAPRDTVVRLRFAEILEPNGELYTENLRAARATDYYVCRGDGVEEWEPRFTFHGFRYIEVTGLKQEEIVELAGVVLHSDLKPTGRFRCSNELLNQLQHNIVWGQKSNFLEIPTDCPQRDERLGWTGDAQVFVRTAAFNMDVRAFFHKWMRDARDAQAENGAVPPVVPERNFVGLGGYDGGPAWADATIICPWTIYLCYGDTAILADHYESMNRFMDFLARERCAGHIRAHWSVVEWGGFGDWLALDGSGKVEGATPIDLIGTAFYAYDAAIMAEIAALLGRAEDAARYRQLREAIADAFRRRYVTPDGLTASGTQTSSVLALHFGLVDGEAKRLMARELAHDIEKRGFHLATGFVGTPYLLQVLEANGYLDTAYKLLEQETFPGWLFPVKNGATTIWERWNGWTPENGPADKGMNSYNHYAYGAVGAWMYGAVAGLELDPAQPGYRHILFRPRPGGTLTWAEASLDTVHGPAAIRWERDGASLKLDLTVPDGAEATLQPPPGYGPDRNLPPGRHAVQLDPAL
jgi:alpha-L-rhamnosidase